MVSLTRAIAVLGLVSMVGTATQVAKGKFGAVLLGAPGVGVLNQLTMLFGMLLILGGLGSFNGVIRHVADAAKDGDEVAVRSQIISVTIFLGIFSLMITVGCVFASKPISHLLFADGGQRDDLVALMLLAVPVAVQQRIFRAYLNATRDVKGISRSQLVADISSVFLFALFAWALGIHGAVLAFISMHILLLVGTGYFAWRSGGKELLIPDPRYFTWTQISRNVGYAATGLIRTFAASGTIILIGRAIIQQHGLAQAGIFAVAWKVGTVYLGALYAAAGSYYFPTLVATRDDAALGREASGAVSLYMSVVPTCMVMLIVFGDILIPLLFTREFGPAVLVMTLLLLGDIFRVTSEALGLTLLARRKLVAYTGAYLFFSGAFLILSWRMLPDLGIVGVAGAYLIVHVVNLGVVSACVGNYFKLRPDRTAVAAFVLALAFVAPVVGLQWSGVGLVEKLSVTFLLGAGWLALSWRRSQFRQLANSGLRKLGIAQ
jgi:antigen flippase